MNKHQTPIGHIDNSNIPQSVAEVIAASKENVKQEIPDRNSFLSEMAKDIPIGTVTHLPNDRG